MQLRPPPDPSTVPEDVATALDAAARTLGFRPAVTVLRADRRDEQGVASLAQWAAKGAHLLEADLGLGPGDRLHVDLPAGWTLAAVCLAAWWAGITVTTDGDAEVAVVDEGRSVPPAATDVLRTGAAVDGAPLTACDGEPWAEAVQAFPDAPPPPRATPDLPAFAAGPRRWDQRELLADAAALGDRRGTLGLTVATADAVLAVLGAAARPFAAQRPTVVLDGATRDAAAADRVTAWLPG
ncbi:hypothetical protein [Nitriliruptor alkaliphilus]|uniref:hypothetical protein n=1 Tax=Nitriliruptor alkaliphilus TaxID=427918 RepID=UPI000697C8EF|nr:hypothetical protein [Nitriliruptor alkaliphilus]